MTDDPTADDLGDAWQPIGGEPWEAEAHRALAEVAAAVARAEPSRPGLSRGAAGMALFLAYYGDAHDDEAARARAGELLEIACTKLGAAPLGPDFFAGWTGIGWAVEHLAGAEPDEEDPNDRLDEALASLLAAPSWQGHYDLVAGLCGMAVYAFERLPRPAAARSLERIVAHLGALSEPAKAGRTWHTPPEHMPPNQRPIAPDGYYNLGLAHGVPGIVAVLARCVASGVAETRARALLDEAVTWLLSQRLTSADARYAAWLGGDAPHAPSRTAWCYGDPGVACALLAAARAAGERAWEHEAVDLALGAARRPAERTGVSDGGLCHGAFGLAHTFLRFYSATGVAEFRRAASAWLERGLALRRPEIGLAGFLADRPPGGAVAEPGLLEGIAGIGLALLSALSETEPAWDRAFLIDSLTGHGAG